MKKAIRSIISIVIVICVLSTSLFTGTLALSNIANNLREKVNSAITGLNVTADTTAADIEAVVNSVVAGTEITWKLDFTKVLPTDGAKITLNGTEVEGGVVRGYAGSIKGILNVTSAGENFDVAVDFTLEPTYETIDCTKQVTLNSLDAKYEEGSNGYVADADLLILDRTSGGWNIVSDFLKDNATIKAVIVKNGLANILGSAFNGTKALQAVVFKDALSLQSNAFYASSIKYVDFGSNTGSTISFDVNSFAWTTLKNLHISGYNKVSIKSSAFRGSSKMQQIAIDIDGTVTVASGALNTNGSGNASITTAVCKNATQATAFVNAGAMAAIDVTKTPIVDYYTQVSAIKVIDNATADDVASAAEALDTANAFTVSAEKNGNVFEVSITDANALTVTAYVETFAAADMKTNIEKILYEYAYTDTTTQTDINACLQSVLGSGYTITWLENYNVSEKVDGAEVWARTDAASDCALYGIVPGQDKAAHGSFVIKNDTVCVVIELNKVIEKAECKKYELTGIQKTNGAGISNSDTTTCYYDGASELIIVNGSTIYGNHLNGTKIDAVLGAGVSDNIKAVIVNGNFHAGAWCVVSYLNGLEVAIIKNTSVTALGRQQFMNCSNLKYLYLPDNITTTKDSNSGNTQAAFYGCTSLKTVLVGPNFDKDTFYINKVNNAMVKANAVTKYLETSDERKIINFYNDVLNLTAPNVSELDKKIKSLASYDESYTVAIETTDSEFVVTINDLLVVSIAPNQGVKDNVSDVLTNYIASNDTTSDDIVNEILGIPGVKFVEWSDNYGFEKILATNGARIRLDGKVVEDGIVRGHYGSITGIISITTAQGDIFDSKVTIIIDPVYETIDCTKKTTVTITSDSDTSYSSSEGYDPEADLVIINVTNPSKNIPANYFGATSENKNSKIKAVIVKDEVSTVLEKAFQYTSALQAAVFNKVDMINNYAYYASTIKYIELGSACSTFTIGSSNAFAWSKLTGLYIENRDSVNIATGAFTGCSNLAQIYVDSETVESVTTGAINTAGSGNESVTTVVCNGADAVSKFETAGVTNVIDATAREISVFDVNFDFEFDVRDIVRLKKLVLAETKDTSYDVNNDGAVNATDLVATLQELLGVSTVNGVTELNNTYRRIIQDNELNVAYFGGSVTSGYGATDSKYSWASRVTQYLKNKFPQAEIDSLNAAIGGTGSKFGAYRVVQDLQLETRTPDLVFIDFAINDVYDGLSASNSQKYMENIIRTIYSYAPNADIVMVFITDSGNKGKDFDQLIAQYELARVYGIPCINVGKALCDEMSTYLDISLINSNSPEWLEFFTDTVHPTDAGYERYASYITDYLDKVFYPHRKEGASKVSYMPTMPINTMLVNPEIFNASDVESIDNFTITSAGNLNTTTNGATLTVKFTGTSLKLWCYAYPESSSMECSVDSGTPKTTEIYRGSANHKIFKVADGLSDTEHTVKITFKNIKSKVDIRYFLITGESENKNFSLTK